MTANYCSACGTELDDTANFCAACGAAVTPNDETGPAVSEPADSDASIASDTSGSSMYRATAGLFIGYLVFLAVGFAGSTTWLVLVAVACFLGSLVTMYVDLVDLRERLWGTRPIVWVIGALLVYVVIVPVYLIKRRSVQ